MAEVSVAADMLQSFVRRIESLDDEILALNADKSEVYKELKGQGFDAKVLRKLIADRRKDQSERAEFETIYELYAEALGMRLYRDEGDKPTLVRAHVEIIEQFDADPGEITEPQSETAAIDLTAGHTPTWSLTPADVGQVAPISVATTLGDAGIILDAETKPRITAGPRAPDTGAAADHAASRGPGEENGATNITQLRAPKPLRPNCLNRDRCGASGPVHCWQCVKAMAENKEAAQ